jgi:hypothetical protein
MSLSLFMDFDLRALQEKLLPTMVRRTFGLGYSSPSDHHRSGGNACLLHYAQMSEQLRPKAFEELLAGQHGRRHFCRAAMDLRGGIQTRAVVKSIPTTPLNIEKLAKWMILKVVY